MALVFANLMPILEKMYARYRDVFGMYSFFNSHPLITIVQSIPSVFLLQFGENNRDLLHTFVFNKLAFYDVIIPGRDSEIHLRMPIDAIKLQTKFQVDSVSVTMENLSIFVSNNIFIHSVCTTWLIEFFVQVRNAKYYTFPDHYILMTMIS